MFMRIDKLQIELPAPKKAGPQRGRRPAGAAGRQIRRDVHASELHVPELQLPQQVQAEALLQPRRRITAEELGHVELVSNGVAMLNNGPRSEATKTDGGDITDAPFEDMQDIRLAAAFLSNGGGAMPMNSNGASWNMDFVTTTGNVIVRPAAQFPSRMRRAAAQAARLRDADRPDRPRSLRLPAGARLGPCPCLCAGAQEDHRRRDREDAADAEHQPGSTSRNARSTSTRARTAASTRFSPDDYKEMAGIWGNGEKALPGDPPGELEVVDGMPEGGKIHDLTGMPSAFTPDYAPEEMFEIATKLYKASR